MNASANCRCVRGTPSPKTIQRLPHSLTSSWCNHGRFDDPRVTEEVPWEFPQVDPTCRLQRERWLVWVTKTNKLASGYIKDARWQDEVSRPWPSAEMREPASLQWTSKYYAVKGRREWNGGESGVEWEGRGLEELCKFWRSVVFFPFSPSHFVHFQRFSTRRPIFIRSGGRPRPAACPTARKWRAAEFPLVNFMVNS